MRPIHTLTLALLIIFTSGISLVFAWTGPTQTPPGGNVSTPINIGTTDQVKNGGLSVNSLIVYGNAIISGTSKYLNFGTTAGATGYGIRDNAGVMEVKKSGGSWLPVGNANVFIPTYTAWAIYGTGDGGAAIYNDSGTYKKLMIVGNNSAGGSREVGVWDNLTVSGTVTASGGYRFPDGTVQTTAASPDAGGVGISQTWQNVSASRVSGTPYQNDTGRPIMVSIDMRDNSTIWHSSNGVLWVQANNPSSDRGLTSFIVPPGGYYKYIGGVEYWLELR